MLSAAEILTWIILFSKKQFTWSNIIAGDGYSNNSATIRNETLPGRDRYFYLLVVSKESIDTHSVSNKVSITTCFAIFLVRIQS